MSDENLNVTFVYDVPIYTTSDYIQIVYLILVFLVGVPLNLYTFVTLLKQYRVTKSHVLLLSLHLNICDLIILFFFDFAKICWLITYKWMAGRVACKLVQFAKVFSFALSSNVIVCIGLDRLFSVLYPLRIRSVASRRCKQMLGISWLVALICSSPQLYVWNLFEITPDFGQCTDIWIIWEHLNVTTPIAKKVKTVYQSLHLLFVFWLPLAIVLFSYLVILKAVQANLKNDQDVGLNRNKCSLDHSEKFSYCNNCNNVKYLNTDDKPVLRRNFSQSRQKRDKYRTLKVTVGIVAAYVIFWLPYNVLVLWGIADRPSYESVENYVYFFSGLIAVNTVVNPLIYSRFTIKGIRKNSRTI